ncbi:MAG: uracil-DNA glycosylase family protein [Acidaminococcus fermentans]|nr:uracil-DNA glycosylase family protein [Acidaminococcus fermentans]MDD6288539.1 uracil-DNA glycosylase family protein [Acidaminococcus fermentans]
MEQMELTGEILPGIPVEVHPFPPFLPETARVLILGTFPPAAEKRTMDFYYPNFQNDMWRILGMVYFSDPDHFRKGMEKAFDPTRIRLFLAETGIALGPTVLRAQREKGNASDKFLHVVEEASLAAMLRQIPHCRLLITTGEKATEIVLHQCTNAPIPLNCPGPALPFPSPWTAGTCCCPGSPPLPGPIP